MLGFMSRDTHTLERWLEALTGIGEALGGEEPVSDLVDRVARTACDLLGYDFCAVFLPDADQRALTIVGSHGLSAEYVDQVNANRPILLEVRGDAEAPTSVAYRTGEILVLEDIETVPGIGPWGGVAQEQGYRALVSVPLRRAGRVVGVLNGYRATPHVFDAVELGLVTTLASQVAVALGTAQLRSREQAIIRELRRAEEVHALLTATALRGEGVTGVAVALAELLARPVLIDDVYGRSLAEVAWTATTSEISADVTLDGEPVARVRVGADETDLSRLDERAIEHATVVTAMELMRARTAAEVEQRLRGSLVADLLSTDGGDIDALVDRAGRLGWDLAGPQVLIAVRCQPLSDRLLADATRFATELRPRPLVTVYRGDVVLIVDSAVDASAVTRRLLESLSATEEVRIATAPAAIPADLPGVFASVRGALGLAAEGGPSVIDLNDVAVDHLLLQIDDPERLREFARAALGAAIDYDRDHASELLRTARMLLDRELDRRATAEALHLHPNTVAQRMRRLETLTGLRLSRPRDLLQLTSALTVARIAGLG